jgi:hypothetical protein
MRRFETVLDYYLLKESVIEHGRYRYSAEHEEFLKTVEETSLKHEYNLPAGTTLFRSQLGHRTKPATKGSGRITDAPVPFPRVRMTPEPRSAKEGRINPKGIPCLYLADNQKTAMSEVRPWIGAIVSIGHFRTVRELKLTDCTAASSGISLADISKRDQPQFEDFIWGQISASFSEPVTDSDMKADYAPTQLLAEVFKKVGFDGIRYKSLLGKKGYSFALFDLKDAKLFRCGICHTLTLDHTFSAESVAYEINASGKAVWRKG